MLREIKYGALSGKVRAMYGKLLRNDDYTALIQKKGVSEVVSYLKYYTHYRSILSDVDEAEIHRGHLENILRRDLLNDYSKLIRFTNGKLKKFINLLYMKTEIESLKLIFRVFEASHAEQNLSEDSLLFLSNSNNVNIPKLALAKNLDEFLSGLKDTAYYDVLRPFVSENNETRLFNMEMALDLYYLRNLNNCYRSLLDKQDCNIVEEFAGLESDIFNIFWIYRSKNFYDMECEVIRSYTLPLIYKLNKNTMDALIKAKDFNEYVDILKGTFYGFLFEGKNQLIYEHNYTEFIYRIYKLRFRRQPFTIAGAVSYLRIKELEISNIITIIEGIRYKLPEESIRKFVIGMNN